MTQRLKTTENLLSDLIKHTDSWPFIKPVTKREVLLKLIFLFIKLKLIQFFNNQAADYFTIIKRPMDFGTIKNKINDFKYQDYSNILDDVRLIFSNCHAYNEPSSDVYKVGQRLSIYFENKVKQLNLF